MPRETMQQDPAKEKEWFEKQMNSGAKAEEGKINVYELNRDEVTIDQLEIGLENLKKAQKENPKYELGMEETNQYLKFAKEYKQLGEQKNPENIKQKMNAEINDFADEIRGKAKKAAEDLIKLAQRPDISGKTHLLTDAELIAFKPAAELIGGQSASDLGLKKADQGIVERFALDLKKEVSYRQEAKERAAAKEKKAA